MTTTVVTLTDSSWTLAATGACLITKATSSKDAGAVSPLQSEPNSKLVLAHIGTIAPVDDFAYHEFTESLSYPGTESVYLKSVSGTCVVKVSTVA